MYLYFSSFKQPFCPLSNSCNERKKYIYRELMYSPSPALLRLPYVCFFFFTVSEVPLNIVCNDHFLLMRSCGVRMYDEKKVEVDKAKGIKAELVMRRGRVQKGIGSKESEGGGENTDLEGKNGLDNSGESTRNEKKKSIKRGRVQEGIGSEEAEGGGESSDLEGKNGLGNSSRTARNGKTECKSLKYE